jgi:hypothetical protein
MRKKILIKLLFFLVCFCYLAGELVAEEPQVYFTVTGRKISTVVGQDITVLGLYIPNNSGTFDRVCWKSIPIYGIAIEKGSDAKNIFVASRNGVVRSTDYGQNWKVLTSWELVEPMKVAIDPKNPKTIYTASAYGIWKTTDFGETWNLKNKGLKLTNQTYTRTIYVLPSNPNVIYVGTADGVMVSRDGAEYWQEIGLQGKEIYDIQVAPYDENIIIAATEDHGIYMTKNAGKVWTQITMGLYSKTYYSLAFHPTEKGTIYCGGFKCGFAKSTNFGDKWEIFDNEISNKDIICIRVYDNNPDIIFVGCMEYGFWRSNDGGQSFKCVAECDGRVEDIVIHK